MLMSLVLNSTTIWNANSCLSLIILPDVVLIVSCLKAKTVVFCCRDRQDMTNYNSTLIICFCFFNQAVSQVRFLFLDLRLLPYIFVPYPPFQNLLTLFFGSILWWMLTELSFIASVNLTLDVLYIERPLYLTSTFSTPF